MTRKRVLMVTSSNMCVGGVPKVIMDMVEALKERYTFDLLALSAQKGFYDEEFLKYGGKIYTVDAIEYVKHKFLYPLRGIQVKKGIKKILEEESYDVIHSHAGFDSAPCFSEGKKKGIKVRIVHSHGEYTCRRKNILANIVNIAYKIKLNKLATIRLACSDVAGRSLYGKRRYVNILNPVDTKVYEGIEKKDHDGVNLVQVGYFCRRKNQIFSVKLLAELRKRGIDARLFLVGYKYEEDYYEDLLKIIKDLGVKEYLEFLPANYDKRELFSYGDYSLLPSENEGLPLVALESQAAGVKCLMSDRVSKDSDVGNAEFFGHDNLQAWAQGIIDDLADENKKQAEFNGPSLEEYCEKISMFYENIG